MYDKLKGYARRATQRIREKVNSSEATHADEALMTVTHQIEAMNTCSDVIKSKVHRVSHLLDELGGLLEEIGSAYKSTPPLTEESRKLAEQLQLLGQRVHRFSVQEAEFLKENAEDVLTQFNKECQQLSVVEGNRRLAQLEHDYFKIKVDHLHSSPPPPQDYSRIPRNEKILESWRVELWRATEENKLVCSQLYNNGKRAIDKAVFSVVQTFSKLIEFLSTRPNSELNYIQLPQHVDTLVLPPSTLPPPTSLVISHNIHANDSSSSTIASASHLTQSTSAITSTTENSSQSSFTGTCDEQNAQEEQLSEHEKSNKQ